MWNPSVGKFLFLPLPIRFASLRCCAKDYNEFQQSEQGRNHPITSEKLPHLSPPHKHSYIGALRMCPKHFCGLFWPSLYELISDSYVSESQLSSKGPSVKNQVSVNEIWISLTLANS